MFKLYGKYLKFYKKEVILGPLFKLLEAIFELIVPLIMARIIDNGINKENVSYIWQMGLVLVVVAVVGFCSTLVCQYFASVASQGVGTKLRDDLFKHIEGLDLGQIEQLGVAELLTRMNNDINQVQTSVAMLIRLVIRAPFIVIGAICLSFVINIYTGLIFLAVGKDLEVTTTIAKENLNGIRVVKAFNKEGHERKRLEKSTWQLKTDANKVAKIAALLNPIAAILIALAILSVLKLSGNLVNNAIITQGDVTALVNYLNQILVAIFVVCNLIQIFGKASSSASRINDVFALEPQIKYGTVQNMVASDNLYELKHVTFSYPEASKPSLNDISFSIKQGSFVGIVGGTGSGKSTLLSLLARVYEPTIGEIKLNNLAIASYTKNCLNQEIGFVFQKSLLANQSIRANLCWKNPNLSEQELIAALKTAEANFVLNDAEGLDRMIYQGGKNLSGGERQRLCIARALANHPQILLLDDSLSALDFKTDYNLRKALKALGITIILVTERIEQIKDANLILVLDDGNLVAQGRHEELLKSSNVYQEIYESQTESEVQL